MINNALIQHTILILRMTQFDKYQNSIIICLKICLIIRKIIRHDTMKIAKSFNECSFALECASFVDNLQRLKQI